MVEPSERSRIMTAITDAVQGQDLSDEVITEMGLQAMSNPETHSFGLFIQAAKAASFKTVNDVLAFFFPPQSE